MTLQSTAPSAACSRCGEASARVHSYYTRSPHDLPISAYRVQAVLHVRRFRCPNPACTTVTFAERLPNFLLPYAQRTVRLREALQQLGLALGGAAGARTGQRLHLPGSRDTVLRRFGSCRLHRS